MNRRQTGRRGPGPRRLESMPPPWLSPSRFAAPSASTLAMDRYLMPPRPEPRLRAMEGKMYRERKAGGGTEGRRKGGGREGGRERDRRVDFIVPKIQGFCQDGKASMLGDKPGMGIQRDHKCQRYCAAHLFDLGGAGSARNTNDCEIVGHVLLPTP